MDVDSSRADGRRNRRGILDAATIALMANPEVSVGEIARQAGVTRATVYRHYPDRDLLVTAVIAHLAGNLIPPLLADLRQLSWGEALDRIARLAVSAGADYRAQVQALGPRLEAMARAAIADEPIADEIARRRESGEITSALKDCWMALAIRSLCLSAVSSLADPAIDAEMLTDELSWSLQRLCS